MGAPAARVSDPFAPPTLESNVDRSALQLAIRFLFGRIVRVGLSPLVLALCAGLALGLEGAQIATAWLFSLAMWVPSSAVLFRVTFFPSPPDPWLVAEDGAPRSARDLRASARIAVSEDLLGSLPLLWLSVWIGQNLPIPRWMAALFVLLALSVVLYRAARAALALLLHEAALDIGGGYERAARARLERLLSWIRRSDYGWFLLARARFRDLDLDGALDALDHIRSPDRWAVEAMRTQMAIARIDPEEARAHAARIRVHHPSIAMAIELLAWIHEGRISEAAAEVDKLAALPVGEARSMIALLVAAALAGNDPTRARTVLTEEGYTLPRAMALARCWPAVAMRLAVLT